MNDTGDDTMESRTNIDDFLTVRGFGGGYGGNYMGGGAGLGGRESWAGPGSNAQRIEGVEKTVSQQADCINGTLESLTRTLAMDATNKNVSDGFSRVCDKMDASSTRQSDQMFALARDVDNKFTVVTEQNHQIALSMKDQEIRNVERFCKLESGQSTIIATLSANKEIGEKNAEIQALKTQIQCGCHCDSHHGHG